MRVALDWLASFVPLPPRGELVDRLSMGGFEDVLVEDTGPDLSALRVGQVLERAPHPDADRLSVCRLDLGAGEPVSVVCGAPNVAAGQRVAVALPGTRLPDGTKLEKSKIRGVVSNGMICSERELGISDEGQGILVLPADATPGARLSDVISVGGAILEVGITPNRGDTASVLGLAREVRAHFGGEIAVPAWEPRADGPAASESVRVAIDAPQDCFHYVARIVRDVRVGPSPDWLRQRLEASEIRSVNSVVDVTNLVLLEFGQPLHGFDLARIRGGGVRVRRANAGEKLVALGGATLALDPSDLVIADEERAIALAGVIGGAETEVGDDTRDVLIESANFHPTRVRMAARRHGLRTEASYRFERGVDAEGVRRAADRAARLLAKICGGRVADGAVEERGVARPSAPTIRLDTGRVNRVLGTDLSEPDVVALLARVEVAAEPGGTGVLACRVPSHRNDLERREDLIEEVARIHGYDRIPTTVPTGILTGARRPETWDLTERARDALAAAGLCELRTLPFLSPEDPDRLRLAADDPRRRLVSIRNPIHDEESRLRSTLLPSLLRAAHANRSRQVDRVAVFETGRVFRAGEGGGPPDEPLVLEALVTRGEDRALWEPEPPPLFFEIRGIAERLVKVLGYVATFRPDLDCPSLHPGASVGIEVGDERVGAVGELHPDVAASYGIDVPCAALEIDLSRLATRARRSPTIREVSRHPRVRRDLAVVLAAETPAGDVLAAIRKTAGGDLVAAEIFDRYVGRGVADGKVSLAFRLVFQKSDRTLEDKEVTRAIDRIVKMLAHRFDAELR